MKYFQMNGRKILDYMYIIYPCNSQLVKIFSEKMTHVERPKSPRHNSDKE